MDIFLPLKRLAERRRLAHLKENLFMTFNFIISLMVKVKIGERRYKSNTIKGRLCDIQRNVQNSGYLVSIVIGLKGEGDSKGIITNLYTPEAIKPP